MKNTFYSTLLLSTLLLAGCQDTNTETEEPTPDTEEVENDPDTTDNGAKSGETDANGEDADTEAEADADSDEGNEAEEVTYKYQINPNTFAVEPIDPETGADEKLVLLTYDDAPYGNTMEIAEALEERGVSAIFFVNSMYMDSDEDIEIIQKVHEMGFEVANHTHTHAKLDDYSQEDQFEEIMTTSNLIEDAIGVRPRFFRAPHGVMTDYAEQVVWDDNMTWMNWSFGYDWEVQYQDATALTDITLNTNLLGDGANILMHDRTWTAEATPAIVDGLIEQGFTIVDPKLITHE